MPSFLHAGDLGDLVYGLCAIKASGGGRLLLSSVGPCREPLTPARCEVLLPLLARVPYIEDASIHQGQKADHDLRYFRQQPCQPDDNLAMRQLRLVGADAEAANEAWLDPTWFRDPTDDAGVVLHRTRRYHNPFFSWPQLLGALPEPPSFVGFATEYLSFQRETGMAWYRPTADLLELAQVVASSRLLAANQSVAYALAEAMKVPAVLEVSPFALDCRFARPNLYQGMMRQPSREEIEALLTV